MKELELYIIYSTKLNLHQKNKGIWITQLISTLGPIEVVNLEKSFEDVFHRRMDQSFCKKLKNNDYFEIGPFPSYLCLERFAQKLMEHEKLRFLHLIGQKDINLLIENASETDFIRKSMKTIGVTFENNLLSTKKKEFSLSRFFGLD